MPLNELEASEKFDLAIKQIKAKNTKTIDFSGIPLTKEQLITIIQSLSEINEPQELLPFVGEEYKTDDPMPKYHENIKYILMNGCSLNVDNLTAIQDILSATRLHGLSLDDNDLDGDALSQICSYYIKEREEIIEVPTLKVWARGNNAYDEDLQQNTDLIEFDIVGDSVAVRIDKIYKQDLTIAHFKDEILSIYNLNKLKIAVRNNPNLRDLSLTGAKLDEATISIVAEMLESHPNLKKLSLDKCDLNDAGIKILYPALLSCKKLTTLFLDANNIASIGASYIAKLLTFNNLQFLTANNNPIGDIGITSFASIIPSNRALIFLELEGCMITADGATKLIGAIQSNKKLQSLLLSDNPIGDDGVKILTTENLYLQYLYLDKCGITDVGAKHLAVTMLAKKMPLLHMISAKYNEITELGINGSDGLAAGLTSQTNLEYCNLSGNPLGDTSMPALAILIEQHFKLLELHLSKCGLTDIGINVLATALKGNARIAKINLSRNNIMDSGITLLSKMLSENYTLTSMLLRSVNMTNEGAEAIYQAVSNNPYSRICSVDISKNLVSEHYIEDLHNMYDDNSDSDSDYSLKTSVANNSKQDGDTEQASFASQDTLIMEQHSKSVFNFSDKSMLTQAKASLSVRPKNEDEDIDEDTNSEISDAFEKRAVDNVARNIKIVKKAS